MKPRLQATQDNLGRKAQPLLEPGERIEVVFPANGGPPPISYFALGLFSLLAAKTRVVALTDRNLVVLGGTALGRLTEVRSRLPRTTPLPEAHGAWFTLHLGGEDLHVAHGFHPLIARASELSVGR